MRWFKHFADARLMPEMRNVERVLGEAGYARAYKLFEFIAQIEKLGRGTLADSLSLDMRSVSIPLLAEMWGVPVREARRTLEAFSKTGLIDAGKFRDGVIFVPSMLDALDEWARKRVGKGQLRSHSGVTPELLRIDQSQSQTRSRQEKRETNHRDDFSPPLDQVRLNFQTNTILSRAGSKVTNVNAYVKKAQKSWDWEAETRQFLRDLARSIISAEPAIELFDLAERLKQDAAATTSTIPLTRWMLQSGGRRTTRRVVTQSRRKSAAALDPFRNPIELRSPIWREQIARRLTII
jgi:hypothetical protein